MPPTKNEDNSEAKTSKALPGFAFKKYGLVYGAYTKIRDREIDQNRKQKKLWTAKRAFWFASVIVPTIGLVFGAFVTRQATATQRETQKAFLKEVAFEWHRYPDDPNKGDYLATQTWQNLGKTPAKHVHYDWKWDFQPPPGINGGIPVVYGDDYIPTEVEFRLHKVIPFANVEQAAHKHIPIYIWGQVSYEDVFADYGNHGHIYRYCAILSRIDAEEETFQIDSCGRYQCIDETCEDYEKERKKLK